MLLGQSPTLSHPWQWRLAASEGFDVSNTAMLDKSARFADDTAQTAAVGYSLCLCLGETTLERG